MNTRLQVVQHLKPGGIETMVLDLERFAKRDEETLIVSLEGCSQTALESWPRLWPVKDKIIFLDKQPGWDLKLIKKLCALIKKRQVQSVHTHHIGPLIYAGLAARICGVKHRVHTEHDAWHLADKKRRILQSAALAVSAPKLVADAQTVAQSLEARLGCKSVEVIPNGIDTEKFSPGSSCLARQTLGLPMGRPLIGASGRLEKVKGHRILIEAMTFLPKHMCLAIAGDGSEKEALQQRIKELGLEQRVFLLGRIDDMPTFYRALNVFCLPSFKEGMPLSPLEAQACNVPAVVTNVGGSVEALCKVSGMCVAPGRADLLASGIECVLQRQRFSQRSPRAFVVQNADVRSMVRAYSELCG